MPRKDKERGKAYNRNYNVTRRRELRLENKIHVLTYYGKNGKLQCSWPDCEVTDVDLLTLDHVNNDGHLDRRRKDMYENFSNGEVPKGDFQTLCWNHQWKKELMRRRDINT